jgi:hypothetical protein
LRRRDRRLSRRDRRLLGPWQQQGYLRTLPEDAAARPRFLALYAVLYGAYGTESSYMPTFEAKLENRRRAVNYDSDLCRAWLYLREYVQEHRSLPVRDYSQVTAKGTHTGRLVDG